MVNDSESNILDRWKRGRKEREKIEAIEIRMIDKDVFFKMKECNGCLIVRRTFKILSCKL